MSRKTRSPSGGGAGRQHGAPQAAGSARTTPSAPTPHRPVVSLALVLFVPALWLVLHGNLSVQTALLRFIGALLVSWVAARLVFATLSSFAGTANTERAASATGSSDPQGRPSHSG